MKIIKEFANAWKYGIGKEPNDMRYEDGEERP